MFLCHKIIFKFRNFKNNKCIFQIFSYAYNFVDISPRICILLSVILLICYCFNNIKKLSDYINLKSKTMNATTISEIINFYFII